VCKGGHRKDEEKQSGESDLLSGVSEKKLEDYKQIQQEKDESNSRRSKVLLPKPKSDQKECGSI
jgi:hypothetical protein